MNEPKPLSLRDELRRLSGVVPLDVPGLTIPLYCKYLTMEERIEFENRVAQLPADRKGWAELLVASALCDEQGNLLYSLDDLDEVRHLPAQIAIQLSIQFGLVNPVSKDAVEDAKKNS